MTKATRVPLGRGGYLVLTRPWPAISRTIWGDPDRYVQTYFSKYGPEVYVAGRRREARRGRVLLAPRADRRRDERRRSPAVDLRDRIRARGQRQGRRGRRRLETGRPGGGGDRRLRHLEDRLRRRRRDGEELREHVATKIGKIARPHGIIFTADLPKTRSGKIMRRLLRDVAHGRALGDVTTLANAEIVEQIREMSDNCRPRSEDDLREVSP